MDKKGDATVLETLTLFQVVGGVLFFFVMLYALNQVFSLESKQYSLSLNDQFNLGKALVKNADGDAEIFYLVGKGVNLDGEDIDRKRTSSGIINNLGSKQVIIEKKGGVFRIYERLPKE